MKSYSKRAAFIVCSLIALLLFLNSSKLTARFGHQIAAVNIVSASRLEELTADKEYAAIASNLMFNDAKAPYDRESGTVYLPQNMSSAKFEGKLKSPDFGCQLYFKEDEYLKKPAEAIETGYAFELYAVTKEEYSVYSVVFTGMPVMSIATESSGEEAGETVYQGQMQVYDPYHTGTQFQSTECSYHRRGGSSEHYEKANYKLELSGRNLSFLGMRKDNDWILNSLYDDDGLVHNKISFQMWQEIAAYNGVPDDEGVTGEYVELFIDDEYRGVYLLTERIDKKALSLGKNDILYKCRADRIPEEHNYTNENTDEMRPIFVLKYPGDVKEEDWEPLKQWVNAFCRMELGSYEEGESLLHMENAIDYNLFTLLICGVDNKRKNVYLIAEYQKDGTCCFKKVPWDMNATWGNLWVEDASCNYTIYDPASVENVDTWCTDISTLYYYGETKTAERLWERWKEFREQGLVTKEKLQEMADVQFKYLHASGAYDRNYARWPNGMEYWKDEYIYEYIDGRIDFLDTYFERLYNETLEPAIYEGVDYSDEFEVRFYWERYKAELSEWYPYDREQLLEHYIWYGIPYGLHGRRGEEFPDDWEYLYGAMAESKGRSGSEGR